MIGAEALASEVLAAARAGALRLATAESCTGGLVASALTAIAGSSDVVEGGVVTYSNALKTRLLGVPEELISTHGAVSAEIAAAMAGGALSATGADVAVAVTGIAGPGGGSVEKPVGLVYFAIARNGRETRVHRQVFADDGRAAIRAAAVSCALRLILDRLTDG